MVSQKVLFQKQKKNDIWCIFYSEEDFEIFLNKTKVSFSKEKYNFFKQFSSNDVRDFFLNLNNLNAYNCLNKNFK